MKKLISRSSLIELAPYEFALKVVDIQFIRKNEFISGAIGELPFTETWPELWLIDENNYELANCICLRIEHETKQNQQDWTCLECKELNGDNFEFCWSCGELQRD